MCGIFGFISLDGRSFNRKMIEHLGQENEGRGRDAHGIAWLAGHNIKVFKKQGPFNKKCIKRALGSTMMIGHTRASTHGAPHEMRNNHPHIMRNGCYVHNGVIGNYYHGKAGLSLYSECDSELFGAFYARNLAGQEIGSSSETLETTTTDMPEDDAYGFDRMVSFESDNDIDMGTDGKIVDMKEETTQTGVQTDIVTTPDSEISPDEAMFDVRMKAIIKTVSGITGNNNFLAITDEDMYVISNGNPLYIEKIEEGLYFSSTKISKNAVLLKEGIILCFSHHDGVAYQCHKVMSLYAGGAIKVDDVKKIVEDSSIESIKSYGTSYGSNMGYNSNTYQQQGFTYNSNNHIYTGRQDDSVRRNYNTGTAVGFTNNRSVYFFLPYMDCTMYHKSYSDDGILMWDAKGGFVGMEETIKIYKEDKTDKERSNK